MNYLTSVLAAHLDISQTHTFRHSEYLEEALDAAIVMVWRQTLKAIYHQQRKADPHKWQTAIIGAMGQIRGIILARMESGLLSQAYLASKQTQETLVKVIPREILTALTDSKSKRLMEARTTPSQRRQIKSMLFDPMEAAAARSIVYGTYNRTSWADRLSQATRLATPEEIGPIVADWAAGQQSYATLEARLMPIVQNVRVSARRIARTEAQLVAQEARFREYEQLGPMIIGYQIHGTMDARIRPAHAARNGNVYYRNPQPGQLSMALMPRPPIDEDGSYAHNCRCWLTPVIDTLPHIENDPAAKKLFTDAKSMLVPDPSVYSDWFRQADDYEQAQAVGRRRLEAMRERHGDALEWGHFLNPKTGRLMSLEELQNETPKAHRARMQAVNELLEKRRYLAEKIANYGYLPPENKGASLLDAKPLPAKYPKDHWLKVFTEEKISKPAANIAIQAKLENPNYAEALAHAIRFGTLRGYTANGATATTQEASKIAAEAQYLQETQTRPTTHPMTFIVGLPPGTLAEGARRIDWKPLEVKELSPLAPDWFSPELRGREIIQIRIEPGTKILAIGQRLYLPPGKYKVLWVQAQSIAIGPTK